VSQQGYTLEAGFELDANGVVEPVTQWVEGNDGKRVRSDAQATNDEGVPLWNIHVNWLAEEYGREVEKTAIVTVPSLEKVTVKRHRPIRFKDLTLHVSARLNNGKAVLNEKFTATGFSQTVPPQAGSDKQ
jgi:hypothetical protein